MPFAKELAVDGESFLQWQKPFLLFDVAPSRPTDKWDDRDKVMSPCGRWAYTHNLLRRGEQLTTVSGNRKGTVVFDCDVYFPTLVEVNKRSLEARGVWMSTTPMEVFTLRAGIRRSTKDVIVAGLGLGYQLMQVCARRKVKSVTVVELCEGLADWLWPVIETKCNGKAKLVKGDARKLLPEMTADVALIDIWDSYGGNAFYPRCPNIGYVWCWGGSYV
jgi:hypothetical protein